VLVLDQSANPGSVAIARGVSLADGYVPTILLRVRWEVSAVEWARKRRHGRSWVLGDS
jgi:hypothetical protein